MRLLAPLAPLALVVAVTQCGAPTPTPVDHSCPAIGIVTYPVLDADCTGPGDLSVRFEPGVSLDTATAIATALDCDPPSHDGPVNEHDHWWANHCRARVVHP